MIFCTAWLQKLPFLTKYLYKQSNCHSLVQIFFVIIMSWLKKHACHPLCVFLSLYTNCQVMQWIHSNERNNIFNQNILGEKRWTNSNMKISNISLIISIGMRKLLYKMTQILLDILHILWMGIVGFRGFIVAHLNFNWHSFKLIQPVSLLRKLSYDF